MMNKTKQQIDDFVNEKLAEVTRCERYIKGEYSSTQTYRWENEKYESEINIAVIRKEKNND